MCTEEGIKVGKDTFLEYNSINARLGNCYSKSVCGGIRESVVVVGLVEERPPHTCCLLLSVTPYTYSQWRALLGLFFS